MRRSRVVLQVHVVELAHHRGRELEVFDVLDRELDPVVCCRVLSVRPASPSAKSTDMVDGLPMASITYGRVSGR